jgi:hypothetical protein
MHCVIVTELLICELKKNDVVLEQSATQQLIQHTSTEAGLFTDFFRQTRFADTELLAENMDVTQEASSIMSLPTANCNTIFLAL